MHEEMSDLSAIQIPLDRLSQVAVERLIEEFIMREGTDYGEQERSLEVKKAEIRQQLLRRDVLILFDPETESTTLVPKELLTSCRR